MPITELEFLRKLQRLLNEGDFVATYKFALLNSLADLSIELSIARDGSTRLPLAAIAEKFIEYYWPQVRPYRAVGGTPFVLRQNAGRQASVINLLARTQAGFPSLSGARTSKQWSSVVRRVAAVVAEMPLWKLQTVGGEADEFLYRRADFAAGSIKLQPGVPAAFRTLYGLVLDAIRGSWIRQINAIGANRSVLGESDLTSFLFGDNRNALRAFAQVLREHQAGRCLYCRREVGKNADVDHFIPWSRYPADLGFNLVLAHHTCNANKRDFLAHPIHIESWHRSHVERADELQQMFASANLPHDAARTNAIVWWAYEQGEAAGAHVWMRDKSFERLDGRWRAPLSPATLPRVAEPLPAPYSAT